MIETSYFGFKELKKSFFVLLKDIQVIIKNYSTIRLISFAPSFICLPLSLGLQASLGSDSLIDSLSLGYLCYPPWVPFLMEHRHLCFGPK